MESQKRNVLVTGGAGYVGSHACKALAGAGYTPITYDNLSRGHRQAVKWGPLEEGDIAERDRLYRVIEEYRPAGVMHFASFAYVGESVSDPGRYYRNNVAGTLALLETLRDNGVDKVIFSSSCAVYGFPDALPITENHPQLPINPYGSGKLMIEWMLRDLSAAHGMRSISLRYFNVAGADPEGEVGEEHDPETHLIPLAIQAALGQRPEVEIYGTDYGTPDGTAIRDYVHVTDLAGAHVLALGHLLNGGQSEPLNLGTGKGHSVREVVAAVERVSGRKVPVRETGRRPGDPPVLVADPQRARDALGWRSRFEELEGVVETAWRWFARKAKGDNKNTAPRRRSLVPDKAKGNVPKSEWI